MIRISSALLMSSAAINSVDPPAERCLAPQRGEEKKAVAEERALLVDPLGSKGGAQLDSLSKGSR